VAVLVLVGGRVTFPQVPPCRPRVDAALAALPEGAEVAAMPCLVPRLVGRTRVHALWPGRPVVGAYAVLRTSTTTWPFSEDQAAALAERLASDPSWTEILACGDFVLLEHEEVGPPGAAPS
jgi:hypothetical protein